MSSVCLPTVTTGMSAGWIINQASEKANVLHALQRSSPGACISSMANSVNHFTLGSLPNTHVAFMRKEKMCVMLALRKCCF